MILAQIGIGAGNLVLGRQWFVDIEHFFRGSQRSRKPQRPSESVWPGRRSRQRQPLLVDLERSVRVDNDIAVFIFRMSFLDDDLLMPAVHPGNRIGVNRESDVLVDAAVRPENT